MPNGGPSLEQRQRTLAARRLRLLARMVTQRTLQLVQFRPGFSQQELADLQTSIRSSRLPAETFASRQEHYGITHAWMKKALERWQNGFDW